MSDQFHSTLPADIDRDAWVGTMVRSTVELLEADRVPNPIAVAFLNAKHLFTLTCRPTEDSEQDWERSVIQMATAMMAVGATNFIICLVREVNYTRGTYPSIVVTEWSPSAALTQAMPFQRSETGAIEILDDGTQGDFVVDTSTSPSINDEIWDSLMPIIRRLGFGNLNPANYLQYLLSQGHTVQFADGVTLENLNSNVAY